MSQSRSETMRYRWDDPVYRRMISERLTLRRTPELEAAFVRLMKQRPAPSWDQLVYELGVSRDVLVRWARELGLSKPRPSWRTPDGTVPVACTCGWSGRRKEINCRPCPTCGGTVKKVER